MPNTIVTPAQLVPTLDQKALFPLLSDTGANGLPPVVELARNCCSARLRPIYDWSRAHIEQGTFEAPGLAFERYLLVSVPSRYPFKLFAEAYIFELIENQADGWQMDYAYGHWMQRLSGSTRLKAEAFLRALSC